MSIPAAYVGVIIIWSTTPLAIQWSSEGSGFLFGATARMLIAVCAALLLLVGRGKLPWHRDALMTYVVAGMGIFGGLVSVYWASQFLPSGWVSVLFATAPLVTGLLASRLLGEDRLDATRVLGIGLGMVGLIMMFGQTGAINGSALAGMLGVISGVAFFSASTVAVQRIGAALPGMITTAGGLAVAAPLFALSFLLSGEPAPVSVPPRALAAIVYLGLVGSVLGFTMYYYVLHGIGPTRVSLITMVTPVLAMYMGHTLNAEPLNGQVLAGTACIMAGLALFEFGPRRNQVASDNEAET